MFKVVRKQTFSENLFLLDIAIPSIAQRARPGHHVDIHLNPDAPTITLPIAGVDAETGTITVVERARDLPSEQLMMLGEGDEVFQVRGPLGAACAIDELTKVALAAEGLGVASLLPRARAYKAAGAYTICVLGFPRHDAVYWQDEFSKVCEELYVTTLDGSYGVAGRITVPLKAVCEAHKDLERLVVIGGLKNMKRAAKIAADYGIPAKICFDAIRPPVGSPSVFEDPGEAQGEFAFAKAPELDAGDIDFDQLIGREKAIESETEESSAGS